MELNYRPKITEKDFFTVRRYNRFLSNFIDKFIWGKNKKFHDGDWTKEDINRGLATYAESYSMLKESYLKEHLTTMDKGRMHYYVNSPFTCVHLLNVDIDVKDEYKHLPFSQLKSERQAIIEDLPKVIPSYFADAGTSGKSINFYFIARIDYQDGRNLFTYSNICKSEQELLTVLFKEYFKTKDYKYYKFDDIKGRTSGWQNIDEYFHIDYFGKLSKLPLPDTYDDFGRLYSLVPIDIKEYVSTLSSILLDYIESSGNTLFSSESALSLRLYLSNPLSSLSPSSLLYNYSSEEPSPLHSVCLVTSTILSTQITHPEENKKKSEDNNEETEVRDSIEQPKSDKLEDIIEETDAVKRSRNYAFYFFTLTYTLKQRIPTFDEYRESYRDEVGTGAEESNDVKRLKGTYDYMVSYFNPEKIGRLHTVGEWTEIIKDEISQFTIDAIRKTKSSDMRKIKYEDIDIAVGFFFVSLSLRMMQINEAKANKTPWNNIEEDSFSLAQNCMVNYFKSLKTLGVYSRSCNRSRVKALKEILLHMDWIECIDGSYTIPYINNLGEKVKGRGRRYLMTKKFPKYDLFKNIVGEDNIQEWKDISERNSKQNSKVG